MSYLCILQSLTNTYAKSMIKGEKQMQINKDKVSVFISSKCDSEEDKKTGNVKYGVMRKSLKLLLEETGFCTVYAFEDAPGTSVDVVHSYMDKLDDSDLVIIIIDNKDNVTDATLKEISRAKAQQKKCIYIFCNEREKEVTSVQKELLSSLKNPRYIVVSHFSDIAEKAYEAVVSDVISIFNSYCRGRVDYRDDESAPSFDEENIGLEVAADLDLTKDFIEGFAYTKHVAKKASNLMFGEITDASNQDKNCASLLSMILGENDGTNVDFSEIKKDIRSYHRGNIQKVVMARYEAVEQYFKGNLEVCIGKLNECIEICNTCKNIPKWLYNDLALDLRNIQIDLDKEKDIHNYNSVGQILLNQDNEPLYYPVIDRIAANHNEKIYKHLMKKVTQSLIPVNVGGVDCCIDDICEAYIVAYAYGSITHMLMTRKRLYEYLISISLEVRDHKIFMLCVRLLILSGESKGLKSYLKAYGENTNNINAQDVNRIFDSVVCQPIKLQQIIARELLMENFGYYYTDEEFKTELIYLVDTIKKCLTEKFGIYTVVKPLLDLFYENRYRVDENDILEFVYFLYENNAIFFFDDAFKLLYYLRLNNVTKVEQRKYQEFIITCLEDKNLRDRCNNLKLAAQTLRQVESIGHSKLDSCVKKTCPLFYKDTYLLNTSVLKEKTGWIYVEKQIDSIRRDNATQGKNGAYYGNAYNSYITIGRIISKSELKLNSRQLKMLLSALKDTLFAELQTIDAKVNAMELICLLQLKYSKNKQIKKLIEDINVVPNIAFQSKNMFMEKGYSSANLALIYSLLQNVLKMDSDNDVSRFLIDIQNDEIAVRITAMREIERLAEQGLLNACTDKAKALLIYHTLSDSYSKNSDLKFYAMAALANMIDDAYREQCLDRFVEMMDYESYSIKVGLLYRLKKDNMNDSKIRYIFEKGKNDTHFWVRHVSNEVLNI